MNRITLYDFILDEVRGGRYYDSYLSDGENAGGGVAGAEERKKKKNLNEVNGAVRGATKEPSTGQTNNPGKDEQQYDFYKFLDTFFKTDSIPENALEHMLNVPYFLEKIMSFSFLLCLDNILYDITFMPVQVIRSLSILLYTFLRNAGHNFLRHFCNIKNFKFYKYATTYNHKDLKKYKARIIKSSNKFSPNERRRRRRVLEKNKNLEIYDQSGRKNSLECSFILKKKSSKNSIFGHHRVNCLSYNVNYSNSDEYELSFEGVKSISQNNSIDTNTVLSRLKSLKKLGSTTDLGTKCDTCAIHPGCANQDSYENHTRSVEFRFCSSGEYTDGKALQHGDSITGVNIDNAHHLREAHLERRKRRAEIKYNKRMLQMLNKKSIERNAHRRRKTNRLSTFLLFEPLAFAKRIICNVLKSSVNNIYNVFKRIGIRVLLFFHMNRLYSCSIFKAQEKKKIVTRSFEAKCLGSGKKGSDTSMMEERQSSDDQAKEQPHDDATVEPPPQTEDQPAVIAQNADVRKGEKANQVSHLTQMKEDPPKEIPLFLPINNRQSRTRSDSKRGSYQQNVDDLISDFSNQSAYTTDGSDLSCSTNPTDICEVFDGVLFLDGQSNLEEENDPSDSYGQNQSCHLNPLFMTQKRNSENYLYYKLNEGFAKRKSIMKNISKVKEMKRKLLRQHLNSLKLSFPEYSGLIRMSLILICIYIFSFVDTSRIYHYIRAQPFMKLYVVLNMLEIVERLLRSLGKDLIDDMIRTFIRIINLRSYVYIVRNHYTSKENERETGATPGMSEHNPSGVPQGRKKTTFPASSPTTTTTATTTATTGTTATITTAATSGGSWTQGEHCSENKLPTPKHLNPFEITPNDDQPKNKPTDICQISHATQESEKGRNKITTTPRHNQNHQMKQNQLSPNEREKNKIDGLKNNKEDQMNKKFKIPIFYPFYSILIKFIVQYIFVLTYILTHAFAHLIRFLSLNIAINSSESTMFLILVMSNFTEIKSTVFKKFSKTSLFTIVASDAVERFYLFIDAFLVLLKMSTAYRTQNSFFSISSWLIIILLLEVGVDWCKHSYLLKYNKLDSDSLNKYFHTLLADVLISRTPNNNIYYMNTSSFEVPCKNIFCFSHIPTRRLGYMSMPVVTLIVCSLPRLNYLYNISHLSFALSIWVCLFLFKITLSVMIVSYTISQKKHLKNLGKPYDDISAM
ncbi:cyclic amine resistance locus protein, putative [Plasmodium knowlesi strain H]|uniref:Cyclic amine resistance locus protein, putative n=3 Tax=Plasmodium knowlesi TaxID=5850 RepID=A0A5K1VQS6_PLAKH|nr:uncharacterized protein PKNH_0818900 [Plasmodium knowlesi strain H]OTN65750.1 putative Cyclic amine resistance locus protein [Plasmodium knowlesi]CAA9987832.1 cyclic amine resistance locus protein, putative [Plasmodium knowlesi strain H]SBO22353.1 cyclic amine resistance locus protein, putative [Plasmodium knowlesi strain H]SBO28765.1 cyclic amine resistance locus protein, putative [Plasmodium knowlesi strain H]VVS77306.1 cyclic amine resistance locus protein, putative [Plasmodium knowlesi |eukprot:XP_002258830.1 [Plasmodium knowlesi strain H]